jgi:transcriptional regulator with XRE-family HTH domain
MAVSTFAQILKRYRLALTVTLMRDVGDGATTTYHGPCPKAELSRRSGFEARRIYRYEAEVIGHSGAPEQPRRETVMQLAEALELDAQQTDRLLIAAGHWPWPDLEDSEIEAVIAKTRRDMEGED